MPNHPESTPIDLTRVTEATRRALYDAVVAIHFSPTPEEIREARRSEEWYPTHTADECRVSIAYLAGRWFANWLIPEAPADAPEDQRYEVLRVEPNLSAPFGIELYEV
jgi:hypothetical protein